ncbi:unnamed protein product [Trichobilharzia szidati]|nr:unnamed protein product [Trichobilharzia szidati]
MENPGLATPVKISPYGDEFGITTPSGGLIFNPFHKEFLNRVGQVNFSPGIFAYNPSPIGKSGSRRNTPSRKNAHINLSPDIQGDLFPADIDENPILQLKLQEKLDTQCDDEIQNTIHSFFKNHLIAPSPDTFVDSPSKSHTILLPRTSSLLPTATPLGKKKKNSYMLENNSNPMCEVAVQTAISMPPSFDFESIMRNVLEQNHSTTDSSNQKSIIKLKRTSTELDSLTDNQLHSDLKSAPIMNNISLSACSVHRPVNSNSNNTNNNNSASIQRKNSRHWLSRRSLFSDSSEVNEEHDYAVVDGDELNEQRTITSSDDLSNRCHRTDSSSIQPTCSTYLSSTQMENPCTKFSVEKFCPNETNCSLIKETAALQMCLPASWADTGISDDDDDDDDNDSYDGTTHNEDGMSNATDLDNSVNMRTLNGTTIEHTNNNNSLDDVVSCGGCYSRPMHLSIDYCSSQMNSPKHLDQHFRCGSTSPGVCYTDISFHSPDLSPILPAARQVNNNSVVFHLNSAEGKNTSDIKSNDSDSSHEVPMPAKCLFPTNLNKSN